jgi:hypothetical protein
MISHAVKIRIIIVFLLINAPVAFSSSFSAENSSPFGIWLGEESENEIDYVQELHCSMIHGHVWWSKFEPFDDEYNFDYYGNEIERWKNAGISITYVIKTGQFWATGDPESLPFSEQRPSHVPLDLSKEWDPEYAYSETYYDFIHTFITSCNVPEKRVPVIIIENEPETPYWFSGNEVEYLGLLKTAYKAAKDADPEIKVLNGGPASMGMGFIILREMVELHEQFGMFSEEEILETGNGYYRRFKFEPPWKTYERLYNYVTDPEKRSYRFVTNVLNNLIIDELPGDPCTVDAVNFHFVEDYQYLDHIVKFFNYRLYTVNNYSPIPLCSDHLGQRIPKIQGPRGGEVLDSQYQGSIICAYDHFKYLVAALYHRFPLIEHYQMLAGETFFGDKASLGSCKGESEVWHRSAGAYRTVAGLIGGKYVPSRAEPLVRQSVKIYQFSRRDNPEEEPIIAAWTDIDPPVTLTLKIPGHYSRIRRVNYLEETDYIEVPPDRLVTHTFNRIPFFYVLLREERKSRNQPVTSSIERKHRRYDWGTVSGGLNP